ncbi:DUF4435 domain-containing protein [Budviciaceae bacterium BWR-B9]|uniref:DUF4435 domain-containing protein n=1 Tax=Limnobaculum allomyrinae TaxID=2791986 RepID=A0ABS1IPL5_9GAMM|nr:MULTISPECIES: DUF4435 domain-containing protein [Limnobaculum]MBK5143502.1 DUF4435 domain-containing protein [Limnobaculum allomyrinae]MBV7691390.1 DUF4435 domain-containing protein [Limnobaculum sp. M2-1]
MDIETLDLDLPTRSSAAKLAMSVFFEEFNDIDIFIEDTERGYEKIFYEIISRVFEGEYFISKIFPLGGRKSVIDACAKSNKIEKNRKELYIIDGDLYLMCGEHEDINIKGLFTLPFYCIENILIDIESIYNILNMECPNCLKDELIEKFSYNNWFKNNIPLLTELFIEYAISFKLNPAQQTVSNKVRCFVSGNDGNLDKEKVKLKIEEIKKSTINQTSIDIYNNTKDVIEKKLTGNHHHDINFISAKDYLIPLIFMRIKMITDSKRDNIRLKLALATQCNIDSIKHCKDYILNA